MKPQTIFILMLVVLVGVGSCLDRNYLGPDQQEVDENSFFTTQTAFDSAAKGMYQKLVFFYNYRGGGENWLHDIRILPDDDATTTSGNEFGSVRNDFQFDPEVHINFPLPASQVSKNPNLNQNSGY